MYITAELYLYPLIVYYVPITQVYIADLIPTDVIWVHTHALSTEVYGEYSVVMKAIQTATEKVFSADPSAVLVAKYLNRDRRDSY